MKIVQIGEYPENEKLIKGGVQSSVHGLVKELIHKKHSVRVISLPNINVLKDNFVRKDRLEIFYFTNTYRYNFLSFLRIAGLLKIIKDYRPDVCHFHGTSLVVLLMYLFVKLARIKSLITVHGLAHKEKNLLFHKNKTVKNLMKFVQQSFIELLILTVAKTIIVDTQYVADVCRSLHNKSLIFGNLECIVIPQGINDEYFSLPDEYEKLELLSVGSLNSRKGHLFLIKAVEKIIIDFPGIELNIVGIITDNNYYNKINKYVIDNNLNKNIKFYTDIDNEKLKTFFRKSNIFVLHSEEESQGIVFCEAMACGKPIVATHVGGVPYVVKNGENGFLSAYSDTKKFSENIKTIIRDEVLRNKFSKKNREVAKQYSWSLITSKILDLYYKIVNYNE